MSGKAYIRHILSIYSAYIGDKRKSNGNQTETSWKRGGDIGEMRWEPREKEGKIGWKAMWLSAFPFSSTGLNPAWRKVIFPFNEI